MCHAAAQAAALNTELPVICLESAPAAAAVLHGWSSGDLNLMLGAPCALVRGQGDIPAGFGCECRPLCDGFVVCTSWLF